MQFCGFKITLTPDPMNVEDIPFFFFSIFILKFISQMDKHYKFFRSIFLIVCGSFQKLIVPIKYVIT